MFDALDEFRHGARWCAFLGSSAEYAEPPAEVAAAIREDSATLRRRLEELAEPIAGDAAPALAEQLLLIVTGALAMRLREREHDSSTTRGLVAMLVDRARRHGPTAEPDQRPA